MTEIRSNVTPANHAEEATPGGTDRFAAWLAGGPCLCWWQSAWLHDGHCCFRDGWSETGSHCHDVPTEIQSGRTTP